MQRRLGNRETKKGGKREDATRRKWYQRKIVRRQEIIGNIKYVRGKRQNPSCSYCLQSIHPPRAGSTGPLPPFAAPSRRTCNVPQDTCRERETDQGPKKTKQCCLLGLSLLPLPKGVQIRHGADSTRLVLSTESLRPF